MAARSVFYVIPANKRDDINLVCAAMGLGPNTFSVPASHTGNEPATFYFGNDDSMSTEQANVFGAMFENSGTLPTIDGTWGTGEGEAGISMGLAKAACAAAQVTIGSNITGAQNRDGTLNGLDLIEIQVSL